MGSMNLKFLTIMVLLVAQPLFIQSVEIETDEITFNFTIEFKVQNSSVELAKANFIKEALIPLGINVSIIPLEFSLLVDSLLHMSENNTFDFSTVRFGGGSMIPDFAWHYASDQYFGSYMLQLNDPNWQNWQSQDIGYTQQEIDQMFYDFDYITNRQDKLNAFANLNNFYFDNLLYDVPLIANLYPEAMWRGFGGPNNELWDVQEGVFNSRALGATWVTNEPDRNSNNTHLRLAVDTPYMYNLDPFQAVSSAQNALTDYTYSSLITFDKNSNPHPDLAWNYFQTEDGTYDDDNDPYTEEVPLTRFTFLLRDDAYWSETTDYNGNYIAPTQFNANDMVLAYDLLSTFLESYDYEMNIENDFQQVVDYSASSTITPSDTFNIWYDSRYVEANDYIKFGSWIQPLPSHILGVLTYYDEINSTTIISPVEVGMPFNPWDSYEWNHWESFQGYSHVGPYEIVALQEGEYYSFRARDDYYYPNEWDVDQYYDSTDPEIQALETIAGSMLDVFAPGLSFDQTAYYWAYAGNEFTKIKPTSQGIDTIDHVIIDDYNTRQIQFDSGSIDLYNIPARDLGNYTQYDDDSRFIVKTKKNTRGPEILIFNVLNEHLKKVNVRKAISLALDRYALSALYNGSAIPWLNIAYVNNGYFDDIQAQHDYDLQAAKNLMEYEGYTTIDYTPPEETSSSMTTSSTSSTSSVTSETSSSTTSTSSDTSSSASQSDEETSESNATGPKAPTIPLPYPGNFIVMMSSFLILAVLYPRYLKSKSS
ncbi:MAG: hypothetical protein INQ03_21105 [Candidatus Heimdallarchaeota archaeon]|nr:hypothetical protein [Candidatus Heimdallarchaeota archaeon]